MIRLFVALRPPLVIREALFDLMDGVQAARWQDDEQLHLTLRFIGEVERPQAEDIAAALSHISAPVPEVALTGVGSFGKGNRPDALWAGVAPAAPLAALHAKVERACVMAGLLPERRAYRPHITVARLPRSASGGGDVTMWLARHAGLTSEPFTLPHIGLYRSQLGRERASYELVARWPLGTGLGTAGAAAGWPNED
jgi:2'-5' RNA ligase